MVIASEEEEVKGGEKSKAEIPKISEGEFSIVHGIPFMMEDEGLGGV